MDKLIHSVFLLPKVFVPFTPLPFVLRTKAKRCGEVFPGVLLVTEWMHPRGTSTKAQDRPPCPPAWVSGQAWICPHLSVPFGLLWQNIADWVAYKQHIYFLRLWNFGNARSRCQQIPCPGSWTALFSLCPHSGRRGEGTLWGLLNKETNP